VDERNEGEHQMKVQQAGTSQHDELQLTVLGQQVSVFKGGSGAPVVVVHRDTGRHGWTPFHSALAEHFTVYAPALPGYDDSKRPEWLRTVPQLAVTFGLVLEALDVGPCAVIGLGFGGWVAVEAAMYCPARFSRLVLQSPMGILPTDGEYVDQFLFRADDYLRLGFAEPGAFAAVFGEPSEDDARQLDLNREMTTRIGWKPYMYDRALPHLLPALTLPILLVTSSDDKIVPASVGEEYLRVLPDVEHVSLGAVGHRVDLEHPDLLAEHIVKFVSAGE
jgi:pimeloyl-ACP methyl ester carboxylesterase